jgi:NAD(P)-dependent dehydrogenase (short-subunit alcohol dehydrogenase family)
MPVALVTGASRGIGKAIAVHLARAGLDIALIARTLNDGEQREHSPTVFSSDTSPLPGSLSATADLVTAAGVRALIVQADLTDRASMRAAAATVLNEWGRIDVLVNNGRYLGPGHMDLFENTSLELIDLHMEANFMAPLTLIKAVLPGMLERGSGTIIDLTSAAAWHDPPGAAGAGGWGLGYSASKGAVHRVAGILHLELADRGILAYNINPGFVGTERIAQDMKQHGFDASRGAPPDVVGAVVAWLVTHPDQVEDVMEDGNYPPPVGQPKDGRVIDAQKTCARLGLVPGWNLESVRAGAGPA